MSLLHRPTPPSASPRGFTLTEVLIALGILAIGLVAVASLFPAGLILQREAVDTTIRQSHVRSMDALLTGLNLDNNELLRFSDRIADPAENPNAEGSRPGITDPVFDVYAVAEVDTSIEQSPTGVLTEVGTDTSMRNVAVDSDDIAADEYQSEDSYLFNFPLSVRCLPTSTPSAGLWLTETPPVATPPTTPDPADYDPDYSFREIYWVPLVRRGLEASNLYADWNVYAFVLQPPGDLRDSGRYSFNNYPTLFTDEICANPFDPGYFPKVFRLEVKNVPSDESEATFDVPAATNMAIYLRIGDTVLGDNGTIYTINRISGDVVGLNADTNYLPLNRRDLKAFWLAPALDIADDTAVADVRLLSNAVVRVNETF